MGLEEYGLDFANPDFVKYAQSYGAVGHRIGLDSEVPQMLEQCFNQGGVHLIEVPIDYSDNDRILNHEIKEKSKLLNSELLNV